jgi:Ca-activated chloride channel family protein
MSLSIPSRPFLRAASAAVAAVLLFGSAPSAFAAVAVTGSLPSFSSGVEMVKLDVTATDRKGRYISALDAGDFQVYEDGVAQQVALFTRERLPISLAVMVDCSSSMQGSMPAVKTAALRLLRALHPEDEAQIVQFNQHFLVRQEFTSDPQALEAAVHAIAVGGSTGLYNALYLTLKAPRFNERAAELRRQAIVLLTDGADTSSLVTDEQVQELARQGNVGVYVISLRPSQDRSWLADDEADARDVFFLNTLVRDTGGRAYFPTALAQLDGVYDTIADELRTQYTLGYVSSNTGRNNRYHRLVIRSVPPNVLVRCRPGYYAASAPRE